MAWRSSLGWAWPRYSSASPTRRAFPIRRRVPYRRPALGFDLLSNRASRHIVQAVIALARDLGLKTIAEGVEDGQTLQLLSQLGVDYAQGFYIGRPEPFAERPADQSLPGRIQVPASARLRGRRPLARRVTSVGDRHA
jgi:predicted signal transduction protein with EAL and GGDEF domain